MPDLKETFVGVLVDALGYTTEEATALIDADGNPIEGAKDSILERNKQAVAKVKQTHVEDVKKAKDAGLGEKGKWYESRLKGLGIELGDAIGEDALEKVKEHLADLTAKAANGVKPLDDVAIKNHKIFRDREKELLDQIAAAKTEHETKWTERDTKEQRDRTLTAVKSKARSYLLEVLKPVLPADAKKAQTQVDLYLSELDKNQFDPEGETFIVKDADGKRVETDHGNPMRFEDWIKTTAEQRWEFQVSDPKSNAGNVTTGTKGGGGAVKKPANRKELADQYMQIADDASLKPEERTAKLAELKQLEGTLAG